MTNATTTERRDRRVSIPLLVVGAVTGLAVAIGGVSAALTGSAQTAQNSIVAADGIVLVPGGSAHTAPLIDQVVRPGDMIMSDVSFTNAGDTAGQVILGIGGGTVDMPGGADIRPLATLELTVGGDVVYDGPLADFADVSVGVLEPGQAVSGSIRIRIADVDTATWPDGGSFAWTYSAWAVQAM